MTSIIKYENSSSFSANDDSYNKAKGKNCQIRFISYESDKVEVKYC